MKLALRLPQGLQERAKPFVDRFQRSVRDFEWTWSKAVIVAFAMWFVGIGLIAIIPSWWLYFADQRLGWHPCPCTGSHHYLFFSIPNFWLFKIRDLVAAGLFSVPFGAFIVIPYFLQKLRRRLRSESDSRPTGGYR